MENPVPGAASSPVARPNRLLSRARDAFLDRRYEEAVERCQEALAATLPPAEGPQPAPEDLADRFLDAWSAHLPVLEAERIAGVFTFFLRRKEQFRVPRGRPVPRRDWWLMITVSREEAAEVLAAARAALGAIERGLRRP